MCFVRAMFGVVGVLITRNRYLILIKYVILLVLIPRRQKANKEKRQNNLCGCWLVTESCLTLCNPTDYSPPGSSVHGIFKARTLGFHFLLQGIFPTEGLNLCLLHWRVDCLPLSHQGKPKQSLLPNKILKTRPIGVMILLQLSAFSFIDEAHRFLFPFLFQVPLPSFSHHYRSKEEAGNVQRVHAHLSISQWCDSGQFYFLSSLRLSH